VNLWKRYVARRHSKAHERVEAERARQKAVAGGDVEETIREGGLGSLRGFPIKRSPREP